jgi:hypothetical protein
MLAAHALRVISAERIVVRLDDTFAVIELRLKDKLSDQDLAAGRAHITPFTPSPVSILPGKFLKGVFVDSDIRSLQIATPPAPRTVYKKKCAKPIGPL